MINRQVLIKAYRIQLPIYQYRLLYQEPCSCYQVLVLNIIYYRGRDETFDVENLEFVISRMTVIGIDHTQSVFLHLVKIC